MQELYNNLMDACSKSESFFYKDFQRGDDSFRIFNYRLASYTEFMWPDALEARGIMFKMADDEPVSIACRPFKKFFNVGENPSVMNLDLSTTKVIMDKMDGSLISTYMFKKNNLNCLGLKTKGHLFSPQGKAAERYLKRLENAMFFNQLYDLTNMGFTVNMEYTAPDNRIVLPYEHEALTVLSIRNNRAGQMTFPWELESAYSEISARAVHNHLKDDKLSFISSIPEMKGVEGFVLGGDWGLAKIKTEWYCVLHLTKDNVTHPRALFNAVIEETSDDLRAMFYDDPGAINLINDMEAYVIPVYNNAIKQVEGFYQTNKHLIPKDYALKNRAELHEHLFSLAMNMYRGNKVDYKDWAKKRINDYFSIVTENQGLPEYVEEE